ncbi:MAG TPA: lytic transglycosylase domain-containing protein [Polyangiales bacterium]|nr:lytic transglycosylase domain-containing protein [Polyangiales bacterium]
MVARFPNDTLSASAALFLLADLTTDDGNDDAARKLYRQLYSAYPTSARAANARFNAAMLTLVANDAAPAAREFDSLATLMPRSDEASAARYWSGRAWSAAGNNALARQRWQVLASATTPSYYGVVAAERLGEKSWIPAAGLDSFPDVSSVDSAFARIAQLDRLGMDVEARYEADALETSAMTSPDRGLATAYAFVLHGQTSRAIRIATKLIDGGHRDARTFRLMYPLIDRDELARDANARGLDPALVAGLIRQESNFNPRAVSVANARGLMQVLPAVGEEISHSLSFPVWNSSLLLDADANLQLGTAHLATFVKQYGALPRVLAAYNAGGSRVTRWATKAGADDPEIFAERIPFTETRDYVRIVQRNAEMYRALYTW